MIKVLSIHRTKNPESKIKAMATITINGIIRIDGVKVIDAGEGPFVSMPSIKRNDRYNYIVFISDTELMGEITKEVLAKFATI